MNIYEVLQFAFNILALVILKVIFILFLYIKMTSIWNKNDPTINIMKDRVNKHSQGYNSLFTINFNHDNCKVSSSDFFLKNGMVIMGFWHNFRLNNLSLRMDNIRHFYSSNELLFIVHPNCLLSILFEQVDVIIVKTSFTALMNCNLLYIKIAC